MRDDQEWCLECGTARTTVHRPPDWRVAVAIVGTVVALALAGFAIALINLSSNANRAAAALNPTTPSATTTPARRTTHSTRPAPPRHPSLTLATWPAGQAGWTVVLASKKHRPKATALATKLLAAGLAVGILDSNAYPAFTPGHWIVFFGRYSSFAAARTEALALIAKGYKNAHAHLVG